MASLKIQLKDNKRDYRPREQVTGEVEWELENDVEQITLRLIWFTSGKGSVDAEEIDAIQFTTPAIRERRPFQFTLPDSPYSFSGKLITLSWGLEIDANDSRVDVVREGFVMSATGKELVLVEVPKIPS